MWYLSWSSPPLKKVLWLWSSFPFIALRRTIFFFEFEGAWKADSNERMTLRDYGKVSIYFKAHSWVMPTAFQKFSIPKSGTIKNGTVFHPSTKVLLFRWEIITIAAQNKRSPEAGILPRVWLKRSFRMVGLSYVYKLRGKRKKCFLALKIVPEHSIQSEYRFLLRRLLQFIKTAHEQHQLAYGYWHFCADRALQAFVKGNWKRQESLRTCSAHESVHD